jgi:patatin-related protein
VYRKLLELTATQARVDVISGTSAGGINGAALALGCVYDTTLDTLRDLWLLKGSFADLLRDPSVKDPPSLLDGDGYFLPALQTAFAALAAPSPRPALLAPMNLALTATMVHAEPNQRLDDLGAAIEDCHHRARFQFSRSAAQDPFAAPAELTKSLAAAARASAAFPVAFEPHLFQKDQFDNAVTQKSARYDRYLIDGGVLDNKPLRAALQAVYTMSATRCTRRVLAYVVPDPAVNAVSKSDTAEDPPSIANVALASMLGIPAAQSISDQLQKIDEHNAAVRSKRHTFAWLAANLTIDTLQSTAENLFTAYRERRIDGLLDYALEQVEANISPAGTSPAGVAFGRRTRDWLKAQWRCMPNIETIWQGVIPNASDAWTFDLTTTPASGWNWGQYPLEDVAGAMMDLLRRTERLNHLAAAGSDPNNDAPLIPTFALLTAAHDSSADADGVDWDLEDRALRNARRGREEAEGSPETSLSELWKRAYALLAELRVPRELGLDKKKPEQLLSILQEIDSHGAKPNAAAGETLNEKLKKWLGGFVAPAAELAAYRQHNAELALKIGNILRDLKGPLHALIAAAPAMPRPEDAVALSETERLYSLLLADDPDLNVLMRRLLRLEVIHYSMAGHSETIDAAVELVQISGTGRSPWGGAETPATKLTGMQLGHFGAFYRKSWRANDWMMGRLDGIDRIVRIALNPDRLHRLYAGQRVHARSASDYVAGYIRALAIDTAAPSHRQILEANWLASDVERELRFLDEPAARAPESLPCCAAALTRRLHLEVLCKELPILARSVEDDVAAGAMAGRHGAALVNRVRWDFGPGRRFPFPRQAGIGLLQGRYRSLARTLREPEIPPSFMSAKAAVSAFEYCPVGSELLTQEVGTDLMTRTASQTLTVAHGAAIGKHSGMGKMGDPIKLLSLPIKFLYLLANRLAGDSRTSAAVATTLLVAGFLFVLGSRLLPTAPDGLALVGWSMLFGWFGTLLARGMKMQATFAFIALAVIWVVATREEYVTGSIFVIAFAAVLIYTPSWVGAIAATLAALWWSTGQPDGIDVAAALCSDSWLRSHCHVSGNAEHAKAFVSALGPFVVVLILSLFAYFGSKRVRR